MYTFMTNLAQMYDTVNQVKVNLVSFSELGILELPMDFYNEIELTDAALNISKSPIRHSKDTLRTRPLMKQVYL